jgi:S1-C subfamily serine protease
MQDYYQRPVSHPRFAGCTFLIVLLLLATVGGFVLWQYWPGRSGLNPQAQPRSVDSRGKLSEAETTNVEVYEQAAPSVVQVMTTAQVPSSWFNFNVQQVPKGVGSGFIWDEDGYIVTN